jgi:hypothetical protein
MIFGMFDHVEMRDFLIRTLGYALWSVKVSQKMHDDLLYRLSRAVMSFYDKTPIGRILTRMSEDMTIIDFLLPVLS